MAGSSSGTRIVRMVVKVPEPTTRAASSSEESILRNAGTRKMYFAEIEREARCAKTIQFARSANG